MEWANGNWPRGRFSNFTAGAVPRIEIGVGRGRLDPRTRSRSNIEALVGIPEQEQDQCEKLGGRIVAARGQVEQDRVGKYEFSALLPENHCCLWLHTTCAAADHIQESCSAEYTSIYKSIYKSLALLPENHLCCSRLWPLLPRFPRPAGNCCMIQDHHQ